MSDKQCPAEAELLAFADADLSPERLKRVEKHLESCSSCAKQIAALSELIEDLSAPVGHEPLDVAEHVASVSKRLDSRAAPSRGSRWTIWGGGLVGAVAAAAALIMVVRSPRPDGPLGHFAARGSSGETALSRDIGVQVYALDPSLRPLAAGSQVRAGTALTAGLRNLAKGRAYLLLFAVDSRQVVHWIAPEYATPGTNPEAVSIAPSSDEWLLPNSAVFDDLAPGSLRLVALITSEPTRVSEVEALTAHELGSEGLAKRFPRAEIRQFMLEALP